MSEIDYSANAMYNKTLSCTPSDLYTRYQVVTFIKNLIYDEASSGHFVVLGTPLIFRV